MANRRLLVKRRKAVRNIRKITRTMQLIATARFQAAYNAAVSRRPYTDKLAQLTAGIVGSMGDLEHPLIEARAEEKRSALVVITSMRGLCGAFNGNVLRAAIERLEESAASGVETEVEMVGRKGIAFFKFLGRPMTRQITNLSDLPGFEEVEPIANALIDRFVRGEIDSVDIVYTKFISTGRQKPVVERLLPLTQLAEGAAGSVAADAPVDPAPGPQVEYEFSPNPEELLDELLPATVRVRLFQAFTDSAVSEQVARMVAMKAATDAAQDMIKRLTREYNRARQTQITLELLDIVGGANALD